jgi:fructose-bisphosphate aldolase class II
MTLVSTRELVDAARARRSGVAAFNIITLEHAEAVLDGALQAGHPVIVQVSENAVAYHCGRPEPLAAAVRTLAAGHPAVAALHLDHVEDAELLHRAADAGFSSVMFDASRLDYQANVEATADAARWAHSRGLYVEAELGAVGGKGGAHTPGVRTDPDEAVRFVEATGVDALAVAVGSSHAMLDRTAALDLGLIERLAAAVGVPLVLHGSSGVPDDILRAAVGTGIVKVNIGTILNVAFTRAVRARLDSDPALVDPRGYLTPARTAVAETVAHLAAVVSG